MTETMFTLLGHDVTRFAVFAMGGLLLTLLMTVIHGKGASLRAGLVFCALALPLSFLLSRGLYCAAEAFTDMDSMAKVLDVTRGGYSIMGVLAGLVLAAWLAEKITGTKHHPLVSALSLAMPAGLLLERLGEAGTGTGLGREVPDWLEFIGVTDPDLGTLVHPVYLYEAVFAGILLLVMAVLWLRSKKSRGTPDSLLTFLTLFGTSQVVLEAFRNDRHMYIHFVQVEQVIAILLVVVALCVWSHGAVRCGMSRKQLAGLHAFFLALCGLTIFMEFRLDRGELKLLYYSVIALCMALCCADCLVLRRAARKED